MTIKELKEFIEELDDNSDVFIPINENDFIHLTNIEIAEFKTEGEDMSEEHIIKGVLLS